MEEKARRINISSTGRAINNGDKQGWVSNSQTRVTPQTPQAAQCILQAEQAQAAQCKGGVLILRKWMTEKVGLVRCFSPGVKRNRRAKNSTVFMQCTLYSVQCVYIYIFQCTVCIHTYIAVHTLQSIGGDSSSYTPCPELMSHVTTRHMFAHIICITLHASRHTCHANSSQITSLMSRLEN